MKHKIFSIYDSAAKAYLTPFFLPEEGMAIRSFRDCVNDQEHAFGRNPADYTLFTIGAWADNTSTLAPGKAPIKLHNGLELLDTPFEPSLEQVEQLKYIGDNHA